MIKQTWITPIQLRGLIRSGTMTFAGNQCLKIYGTLHCPSGKRMKRDHRVFFADAAAALADGYRPCGHCMKEKYRVWRNRFSLR